MFYLFAGYRYYPGGGMRDFRISGTLEECWKFLATSNFDWYQIVNEKLEILVEG